MNGKLSDWAIRIFAILYACVCIWLIARDCTVKYVKHQIDIIGMVSENSQLKNIEFRWIDEIKDGCNIDNIDGYICSDVYKINEKQLKEILNKKFYIDKGENVALGLYRPIALLSFYDESGNKYSVVYSFLNAEVRFYNNAKINKVMMMYDSNHILQIFNKL